MNLRMNLLPDHLKQLGDDYKYYNVTIRKAELQVRVSYDLRSRRVK